MATYEIVKYSIEKFDEWQHFVLNSANGSLFHEQRFIGYHQEGKFEDSSLMIYKNGTLCAVFPAALLRRAGKSILKSHPGTSYGGVVFSKLEKLQTVIDVQSAIEDYAKNIGIDRIEFRQAPKIFLKKPFDQLDFAFVQLGYAREDQELSTCYPLADYHHLPLDKMLGLFSNEGRNKVQKNVRKALRNGLEFRELSETEFDTYYKILLENLVRHKATPAHSLADIRKLKQLYPDRVRLYGVFKEGAMAAGYLIFNINQIGWHVFYGSMNYLYQADRPTTHGLFMLLKTLADQGYAYLNMGISTEDGGKIVNWGLLDFKESFNGTGIIRTYWSKELQ
jgi:hypothetical protein